MSDLKNIATGFVSGGSFGYPVKIHSATKKKDIAKKVCEVTFNVLGYIPVVGCIVGSMRNFRFLKDIKSLYNKVEKFHKALVGNTSNREKVEDLGNKLEVKIKKCCAQQLGASGRGCVEGAYLGFLLIPVDITVAVRNKCGSMGATWGFRSVNSKTFKVEKTEITEKEHRQIYFRTKLNNLFFDTVGIIPVISLFSGASRIVISTFNIIYINNLKTKYSKNVAKQLITHLKCQIARGVLEMSQVGIIVNISVGVLGTFVNMYHARKTRPDYYEEPKGLKYTLLRAV